MHTKRFKPEVLIHSLPTKKTAKSGFSIYGGEGGIRTLERDKPLHAFQACAFSHSATSPELDHASLGVILKAAHSTQQANL